jgi:translation initiation factor 2B subunit (eIF-2B alpha/beta/delta family)
VSRVGPFEVEPVATRRSDRRWRGGVTVALATLRVLNEGEASLSVAKARQLARALNAAADRAEKMATP